MNRRILMRIAATGALALKGAMVWPKDLLAQQFPTHTITIVSPFAAGGVADMGSRALSASLAKTFSTSVIVENRPGAAGAIGHSYVARAVPDGHTVMVTISSLAVIPEINRRLGRPVTYEMSDFVPLARLFSEAGLLWVKASAKWQTVGDLIEDARNNPDVITYGTSGVFGPAHLVMEMFLKAASLRMVHVPYQGGAPATSALLSDQVAVVPSVLSNFKGLYDDKQVRPLLQFGEKRSAVFPDIPTAVEVGYADAVYMLWTGVFAPAKLPQLVQEKLRAAIGECMKERAVLEAITKTGTELGYMDSPEFTEFLRADTARLLAVTRAMNIGN